MDFSSVNFLPFLFAMLLCALTAALHILSALTKGRLSQILSYINLVLHLPFIVLLAFSGVPIIEGVMFVLLSLLVYVSSAYFSYRRSVRGGQREKASGGDEK